MSAKKSKTNLGSTNKALVLFAAKDLRLENAPIPNPPGPGGKLLFILII